mgnify:FL=1|jgi:ATP-dependent Clp protease protease subunit
MKLEIPRNAIVPQVIEVEDGKTSTFDPFSGLLKDRVIVVESEVNTAMASSVVAQLLLLEKQDPHAEITMYINSPGGSVMDGLAIADTMEFISCDVRTVGLGMQASMGSFLLASGTPGKRHMLRRSQIMIHRLSSGVKGDYHSMESNWKHVESLHQMLIEEYARMSQGKRTAEQFEELMRYDNWLTAEQAIEYGIIDSVIESRKGISNE